jgi:hypothetical protein
MQLTTIKIIQIFSAIESENKTHICTWHSFHIHPDMRSMIFVNVVNDVNKKKNKHFVKMNAC